VKSAAEKVERDRRMVIRKIEGATHAQVAEEFGVTSRWSEKVWAEWCKQEKEILLEEDPLEVVLEHIAGFRDLRLKAARVFHESAGSTVVTTDEAGNPTGEVTVGANSAARVGAIRVMMELRSKEIDLRQETNLLPRNLGKLQVELDVRWIVEQIVGLIVKYDMPEAAQDELLALLEHGEEPRQLPPAE
jgi:hypothetical protein